MSNIKISSWLASTFFKNLYFVLYNPILINYFPKGLCYSLLIQTLKYYYKFCILDSNYSRLLFFSKLESEIKENLMIYLVTNQKLRNYFWPERLYFFAELLKKLEKSSQERIRSLTGSRDEDCATLEEKLRALRYKGNHGYITSSIMYEKEHRTRSISRNIIVKNGVIYRVTELFDQLKDRKSLELKEQTQQQVRRNRKKFFLCLFFSAPFGVGGIGSLVWNLLFPISSIKFCRLALVGSSLGIIISVSLIFVAIFFRRIKTSNTPVEILDHEILE
jgi:hypothetical protein